MAASSYLSGRGGVSVSVGNNDRRHEHRVDHRREPVLRPAELWEAAAPAPVDALLADGRDLDAPLADHRRREGCYVYDADGKRYLDGLAALFCVNAGHGRPELAERPRRRFASSDFYTTWSYGASTGDRAGDADCRTRPGRSQRVFFTSGGSEAVESALKLARNYHPHDRQRPEDEGHRARIGLPRDLARGALGDGITSLAQQFEPLAPGGCHVPNTNSYRWPAIATACLGGRGRISDDRVSEVPPVAAVILEPGAERRRLHFTPQECYFQRVREILRRLATCCSSPMR